MFNRKVKLSINNLTNALDVWIGYFSSKLNGKADQKQFDNLQSQINALCLHLKIEIRDEQTPTHHEVVK